MPADFRFDIGGHACSASRFKLCPPYSLSIAAISSIRSNTHVLRRPVRHEQPVAAVLDLRGGDDAGHGASAIEAEAVVLKHMRVGIAGHHPVLGGRRVA